MKSPILLNKRGKRLLKRLKRKPQFKLNREKKEHLRASRITFITGLVAIISLLFSLWNYRNQTMYRSIIYEKDSIQQARNEDQFETTVKLMDSYIRINDSLRNLTSELLEQNRKNYSIQLQKNRSNLEIIVPRLEINKQAVYRNSKYLLINYSLKNSGIFPAQNGTMETSVIGVDNRTVFKNEIEIISNFSNKIISEPYVIAKIPKNEKFIYVKIHLKWYDIGLEDILVNDYYFKYSFLDNDLKFRSATKQEQLKTNVLLNSTLKKLTISTQEFSFLLPIYPDYINYSKKNH